MTLAHIPCPEPDPDMLADMLDCVTGRLDPVAHYAGLRPGDPLHKIHWLPAWVWANLKLQRETHGSLAAARRAAGLRQALAAQAPGGTAA